MKKLLVIAGALAVAVVAAPAFMAFEAHVVNVTATIENALSVPVSEIKFGTVFPQEYLERDLDISLSGSFMTETRVDDVDYVIRQKPKCAITLRDGIELVPGSTVTGHVFVGTPNPADPTHTYYQGEGYYIDCGVTPTDLQSGEFGMLPMLCPYLSKHPDGVNDAGAAVSNDGRLPSFHKPFEIMQGDNPATIGVTETSWVKWNDTAGHLAKSQGDTVDNWIIDLAVPCFGGYCAQDWADFVAKNNELADPKAFVGDIEDQHKVFGCDLWVEVTGISLPGLGCKGKADTMLVLDRSGSISPDEMTTLKNAATAFVTAMNLQVDGAHMGSVSFSTDATLDAHLTDSAATVTAAINALTPTNLTNLEAAILSATAELANPGDDHDRADGDSPDFMVIITDGAPTASNGLLSDADDATAAATAAKATGIQIYVVGIGTTDGTANYLANSIASTANHYFDAAEFADLQVILQGLASCQAPS